MATKKSPEYAPKTYTGSETAANTTASEAKREKAPKFFEKDASEKLESEQATYDFQETLTSDVTRAV